MTPKGSSRVHTSFHRRILAIIWLGVMTVGGASAAEDRGNVPRYHVVEFTFQGPQSGPASSPAGEISLDVTLRHESGDSVRVPGFWDADGRGGQKGNLFKVRFCPTRVGRWTIVETASNQAALAGQHQGDTLTCTESPHHGFWEPEGNWYRRSDGSHQYVVGNTHYSFLSRIASHGRMATEPVHDLQKNSRYYKKVRFALVGCRYPDPDVKPFLDSSGAPTDDGLFSGRPNPQWFAERVDPVIREAHSLDVVCDLILCGPDTEQARSTLQGDNSTWLRYVAARYGAYPNVWFCLCNEWDIKKPSYTSAHIRKAGEQLRMSLPYPNPVSVHGDAGDWNAELNGQWQDHTIIQRKLKSLEEAAEAAFRNIQLGGGKPLVNDENAYQGAGDRFSLEDTVEGCLGTFLGGGYPSTGFKQAPKLGQYFWGGFDPKQHSASEPLGLLRRYVDEHIEFWRLKPLAIEGSRFATMPQGTRVLADEGREYVIGTNRESSVSISLPAGRWRLVQVDLLVGTTTTLEHSVSTTCRLQTPNSRAVLTHIRRID